MSQSKKSPILTGFYGRFLTGENSADFIYSVSQHYSLASLISLTRAKDRLTRRAAALAIGFLGTIEQNDLMGHLLSDRDRGVRLLADHGIRHLWQRLGRPTIEVGLRRLIRFNQRGQYHEAIDCADELLAFEPELSEAWNQRGIAHFSLCDFEIAIEDCERTLQSNPWHFLAALGQGNCYLELGEVYSSLDSFRLALEINPDLESVRSQIDQLERHVEEL